MMQQKRFTSLDGAAESMGDLKSIVLHDMTATHIKSTFPLSLGAKIVCRATPLPSLCFNCRH